MPNEALPLAIAIAASPFPILPAIFLLFTERARRTSLAFLACFTGGIAIVTTLVSLLADVVPHTTTGPPTWASWARITLGGLLVVLGARAWRARSRSAGKTPGWMKSLASAGPRKALGLGFMLSVMNPKVVLLSAAAGLAIGAEASTLRGVAIPTLLFTAVASLGVAIPVLAFAVLGERVRAPLRGVRNWLERHNAALTAIVTLAIGAALVLKGVAGLNEHAAAIHEVASVRLCRDAASCAE